MRIAVLLISRNLDKKPLARVLVFNERITAAEELTQALCSSFPSVAVGMEHSRLNPKERKRVLGQFRTGEEVVPISGGEG
jgi:superfamily II DNA/RNA helicase